MRTVVKYEVTPIPRDAPTKLRLRVRRGDFEANAPADDPTTVRAIFDASVSFAEARAYGEAFRAIATEIDAQILAYIANGGRL